VIKVEPPAERGTRLEVDRSQLPPTEPDEYYAFQLLGLDVVEEGGRPLGTVSDVLSGVANDVLQVGDDVLLPMVEDCIRSVDLDAGRIVVARGFAD
jgi:16S rRNA processing protein RimM